MLEYKKIDVAEGIDNHKPDGSYEHIICNSWPYFLIINFRFQPKLCDGCHNMRQKSLSFDCTAVVNVKGYDYTINFWFMTKAETVNSMKNAGKSE